jgi:alpha/beta hydrolase fold
MNTPHERLTRTTFSLPLGEVHALVGGAVNARPLLFLHGFPDHPPTAVPFLEHLAETHRVVAPWLRGYAPSPIVGPYDFDTLAADALALIDRLGGQVALVGHDWGRRDHLHRVRRRAVARPSRGHARDPTPGHPTAVARLLEAVEEELVEPVNGSQTKRFAALGQRAGRLFYRQCTH